MTSTPVDLERRGAAIELKTGGIREDTLAVDVVREFD